MKIFDSTILLVVESYDDIHIFFSACLGLEEIDAEVRATKFRYRLHEWVTIAVKVDRELAKVANAADLPILSFSFPDELERLQEVIRDKLPHQKMDVNYTPFGTFVDLPDLSGIRIQIRLI